MIFARPRVVLQLFIAIFLVSTTAIAQNTINVPSDQPTIQAAINAANPGDTVLVAPGTYYENIDFLGKAITVTSSGGAAATTIDGNSTGSVVMFHTSEGPKSVLSGFTITHGKVTTGLGGGGIEIKTASPIIENNTITNNQSCGDGGGIFAYFSSAIIRNNTVSYNGEGGCSGAEGGGVALVGNGSVQLLNNVIVGNSLLNGGDGGGVGLNGAGTPTISGNTIQGNSVYNDGGGLSMYNDSNPVVVQNLITGNSVRNGQGGGVYIAVPSGSRGPTLLNNTIANNSSQQGAAVYVDGFDHQSQFVNNLMIGSGTVEAINCDQSYDPTPPIFKSNDAFSSGGAGFYGACANQAGIIGNLSADPLFKDPVNGDFHLQPGSPAIDAGDITNSLIPPLDLAGAVRLGDDSGQCNFVIDLGVYESHPAAPGAVNPSSASLGFPDTVVGSASSPLPLMLTGTGQGCFRISGFNLTGDFSQANSCGSGVPAGQSCTVQVTFTPTAGGLRVGMLSFPMNTNPGTSPAPVGLSGTGLVGHGTPSRSSLSFPALVVNTSSVPQPITLTNDGLATLTVSSVSVTGDFSQTNNCGASIAPGASCSLQVTFTPSATGQRNGSLSIASNSSPAVAIVSLTGSGLASQGSFSPAALSFSTLVVNTTSPAQNVTLTNVGTSPLNLRGFNTSGDFAQTNNCPATLAPNTSCSIEVTFTPTAFGQRTGTLSGPALPTVSLMGSGSAPDASLSPGTLSFTMPQLVNTTSPAQSIVLKNFGTLPLNITGFSISGDYAQTNNCPGTLASNASCSIQVTFTPTAVGGRPGTLSVSSNSAPSIPALSLNGTGAPSSEATINVPADQLTIQAAINVAPSGATVLVAPGTYIENINFAGKAITVTSSSGAASTIIDGNAGGTVVTFNHGESSGAVLNGFTIQNGHATDGAGIYISGASPNVTNNVITNNDGISGIGIAVENGSPTIQGNTVTNNLEKLGSGGTGGAISISSSPNVTSNVSVIGNVITNNHLDSGASGGGIGIFYYASALIQNNYIANNSAYNGGGGIYAGSNAALTIVGNVIFNNSSGGGGDGGGFDDENSGYLLFLNNTLYGNTSRSGTSEIAAVSYYSLNSTFKNNIVYATSGGATSCSTTNAITAVNNIVYSVDPAINGSCAAFAETNGNLFTEPGMVDPANGDFHLHVGSPAVDAGVSDPNLPQTDIGGTTRVLDGNNEGTAVVDIGAYEFVPGAPPAGWAVLAPLGATFPITAVGSSTGPINFALLNNGNAPLTINSIAVNSVFQQANNCPNVLAARTTCLIQVTFAPTANGNVSGTLSVATAGANGTATAPLSGTGNGVFGTISPASIDFGKLTVGSMSSSQSLSLTNTGTAPLVISGIIVTAPFSWWAGCSPGTSIAPGASCAMSVIFRPTAVGAVSGTLTISSNAAAITPAVVNLSGSGDGQVISVTPASLSFGTLATGSSQTQVVTVSNTGDQPLGVFGIQISSNFSQTNNCGSSIASGSSCSINVTFTPSAAQQYTGTLTIYSNTVVGQTSLPVSLSGSGISPISASPSSLSFSQRIGTTSAPQIITITNTSTSGSPLSITNISASSPFAQANTCPASLAAAASCTISVTFSPTIPGTLSSSVVVQYSGGSTSIPVSGSGVQPIAFLSPNSLSFGSVVAGSTLAKTAGLTNSGDAALNISGINVSGTDFQLQSTSCGATLAPSASCIINIAYTPSIRGPESGSLTVTHDASGSPSTIPLSGTGIAPVAGISPTTVTFASQTVGTTSAPQTITLSNTGDAALSIGSIAVPTSFAQTNNCGTSLAAGSTCAINVTFAPTSPGAASGTLTVNLVAPAANQSVTLIGTSVAPLASVSPSSLTFTTQRVSTTSPLQVVSLFNTGTSTLTISSIVASALTAFAQTNNCPATLAPGSGCAINVTFAPVQTGMFTGSITITDDSGGTGGSAQQISLTGTGGASMLAFSPSSLTFGTIKVGTSSAASAVTISNTGTMTLNISSISASGDYSQTNNCGASVAPGANCTVNVVFTPVAVGSRTGGLTLNSDASNGAALTVPLSGTGLDPMASLSATSLTFSIQRIGTTSPAQVVTLSNTGSSVLTISSIAAYGAIAFAQTNNCPATLAAGSSCSINVTFAPIQPDTFYGNVTITDDSGGTTGSTQEVVLTGTGGAPAATISPGSLTFGSANVGTSSAPSSVTITNSGTMALNISSISVSGDFSQSNNCGTSVSPRSACAVNVVFSPTTTGSRSGTLTISGNFPSSPSSVSLNGTGTAPVATFSQASLSFPKQRVGTSSGAQNVTLTNTGTGPLLISGFAVSGDYSETNNCGGSLAPSATCTVSIVFTPTARGTRAGTLTLSSNAGASSISLNGTGVAAVVSFSSTALAFGSQRVNTTSGSKSVQLTNSGDAVLDISGISISAGFTQTNNCTASLAVGAHCDIHMTFAPTTAGNISGALTVSGDEVGGPQSISLSGTGVDYSLSASPASADINAGASATYTITVAALSGNFNANVSLTCSGLPAQASCSFSPSSINPNSTSGTSVMTTTTKTGASGTPSGTYTITVNGTSGVTVHSTAVSLTVN